MSTVVGSVSKGCEGALIAASMSLLERIVNAEPCNGREDRSREGTRWPRRQRQKIELIARHFASSTV
jgi:hypothetical protein